MAAVTSGSLSEKPLAHLFVYSLEKKLTGSLELKKNSGSEAATIVLAGGEVAKIRTSAPVAYLGTVLYELGLIQTTELNQSLLELSKQKRPHGQILLDLGLITREKLNLGLREQALRKLAHCFSFGQQATFAFHSDTDLLPGYGGNEPVPTDPSPAIWRGIREHPSDRHVKEAVVRIGDAPCRLVKTSRIERFQFQSEVLATVQTLRVRAVGLAELQGLQALSPKILELLLYCLLITKELEVVDMAAPSRRASLPQLDAMRASVTKMRAVTPSSPDFPVTPQSSKPPASAPTGPISFHLRAAAAVPVRTSSSPSNPAVPVIRTSSSPSNPALSADLMAREKALHDRAKGIVKEDFFQRLSLHRTATPEAVETAFRMLVRLWDPVDLPPSLAGGRESCALVQSMMIEAHSVLTDPRKRMEYERKLSAGPTLPDPASDLAASGEKNDFDGAKVCLARNDLDRAERMAKRAHKAAPDSAPALALFAWIAAHQPTNLGVDATRARILMLDKAARMDDRCEEAFWYRSQLHKRAENHPAAMKDLQTVISINPENVDAMRELRIYEMRVRRNSMSMQAVRSMSPAPASSRSGVKSSAPPSLLDRLRNKKP